MALNQKLPQTKGLSGFATEHEPLTSDKEQLFTESVERHFGIQSDNCDSDHFDEVNQFIEDNYEYFSSS